MTKLEVNIKSPMTTPEVNIRQLEKWVSGSAKGPRDISTKKRVRDLLDARAGSD
jgi:hypothetical protein